MSMIKKTVLRTDFESIQPDSQLTGLQLLFDFAQVQNEIERNLKYLSVEIEECRGVYVRYKPATNCIVAYTAKCTHGNTGRSFDINFYGKCFTPEDFALAVEKLKTHEWEEGTYLKPVIPLPDVNVIFYVFPNDCEMRGLPTICNARKISRILYDIDNFLPRSDWRISDKRLQIEVVRYKPEKRAVVKIETRAINRADHKKRPLTVYMRSYCDNRGEKVYRIMRELHRALDSHPEVKVPPALDYLVDKKFLLTAGLDGKPLVETLHSLDKSRLVIKAARALSVLHQIKSAVVTARTSTDLMFDARATGTTVKQIVPEMVDVTESILTRLQKLDSGGVQDNPGFVHGDFHCGQILIQDDATVVLDFDRSFLGETLVDVGNFCAHLYILGRHHHWENTQDIIDIFIENYESAIGKKLEKERLKLWIAYGLLLFSVYPFRSLEAEWKSSIAASLNKCKEILS